MSPPNFAECSGVGRELVRAGVPSDAHEFPADVVARKHRVQDAVEHRLRGFVFAEEVQRERGSPVERVPDDIAVGRNHPDGAVRSAIQEDARIARNGIQDDRAVGRHHDLEAAPERQPL